jgi:hypothetical protein
VEVTPRLTASYASREAVGLALAFSEDSEDSDELAGEILSKYDLRGPELELVLNLARLVVFARNDEFPETLYELALWKALR